MALSGTFIKSVGSHWDLKLVWSATQNETANTSTITAKLYWVADSYGAVSSSTSKSGTVVIDGTTSSFTATAGVSDGQSKLIKTYTKTVTHDSDGKGSFSLSGTFGINLTLSGTYYGTVSVSGTASLNTIPRASTIASTAQVSWTAGSDVSVGISRASSNFNHEVEIAVQGEDGVYVWIKRLVYSTSQTSLSTGFSTADNKSIFTILAQRSSANSRMVVQTFSGSTFMGEVAYYGKVTAPTASVTTFGGDYNIGDTISGTITSKNSAFTHIIEVNYDGVYYRLAEDIKAGAWTYNTSAIASALYAQTPNSNKLVGSLRVHTYYEGIKVRAYEEYDANALVSNSNPTFTATITYKDTNATSINLTGNNQYIIQGISTVSAVLASGSKAVAKNGATMASYIATLNGKQVTKTYATTELTFDMGTVNTGSNVTLSIKAVDSRGNTSEQKVDVNILPYASPTISGTAVRKNNFESDTILSLSGTFSPLTIGGVNKNALQLVQYRTKLKTASSYGALKSFTYTTAGTKFTATKATETLDNTQSHDIQFYVTDKLGVVITEVKSIASGEPIFFIDTQKKSLGVNMFPVGSDGVEIKGNASATGTAKVGRIELIGSSIYASAGGGLNLKNSDIINANNIYMNDSAVNDTEGLQWARSTTPYGSTSTSEYDTFRVFDGKGYLNSVPVFSGTSHLERLADVALFLKGTQTVVPTKKLSECPNGWIVAWSKYSGGSAIDGWWNFTYVPKMFKDLSGGMSSVLNVDGVSIYKTFFASDTTITGYDANGTAPNNTAVLRYVYAY